MSFKMSDIPLKDKILAVIMVVMFIVFMFFVDHSAYAARDKTLNPASSSGVSPLDSALRTSPASGTRSCGKYF